MAKYRVGGNTVVRVDATAGGTLIAMTQYIDTISGFGKQVAELDVTGFSDAAERFIAGIETSQELAISGAFDDAASTGPDATFNGLVGTIATFEYNPVGTAAGARRYTAEVLWTSYKVSATAKERVSYEVTGRVDGTVTVGTV